MPKMHYNTIEGNKILTAPQDFGVSMQDILPPKNCKGYSRTGSRTGLRSIFQMGHPKAFELANRIAAITPEGMNHVFYTNSGSRDRLRQH